MRELKFRAWSIGNQRWVYFGIDEVPTWVHSAEVEQYTGLKDKHGREIYEGDIVSIGADGQGEVSFHDGAFYISDFGLINKLGSPSSIVKVIGNIYEHPHLLKEA